METINSCRICKNKNIRKFFDLGEQPLANSLPKTREERENLYSLSLSWCPECNLVQLNETIDPKELFSEYIWVTATSKVAKDYSEIFFNELIKRSVDSGYVLEIASNDGTFLKPFINKGFKVLGVDPAENIVKIAEDNGIPTKCSFFGKAEAENIIKEFSRAQIIFARNVLPHVANTRDFVEGLSLCLNENGMLAIEVHSAKEILKGLHYDSIYHEHLCYFTLKSLEKLLNDYGLYVFDISESPISGGSIVVYSKKEKGIESEALKIFRENEKLEGINNFEKWQEFARKAINHKDSLMNILRQNARLGVVAGYGSSARSSTMLNFARINSDLISVIADANPLKQGRFSAGSKIPIKSPKNVIAEKPKLIVIFAWNFADEITKILREELGYKGRIIIPLPEIKELGAREEIEGVKVIPLRKIPDERGTIMHGVRSDNILNNFGEVYFKKLYKGIINGWHIHEKLILNYICLQGMIKLVLCDMRENSSTYKEIQEIFIGEDNYCLVHIPAGVANAMAVVGGKYALICNVASEPHNPSIKYKRIDPHSQDISYNWNKKDR